MTTTRTMAEKLDELAGIIGGRAWGATLGGRARGANIGNPRIYVHYRKDVSAWFEFPEADNECLGGARFSAFVAPCNQHANWYASQRKKAVEANWIPALAIAAYGEGESEAEITLAHDIMNLDEVSEEQVNSAAGHLASGRLAEASAVLGLGD